MRYSRWFGVWFVLAMSAVCFADDDVDPPAPALPDELELVANSEEARTQQLPETMTGVVLDPDGNPIPNAQVTLVIERGTDLFETTELAEWSTSTNDSGTYILPTAGKLLQSGEDLLLKLRAEGYRPLDCYIDLQKMRGLTLPEQTLRVKTSRKVSFEDSYPWKDWVDDSAEFDMQVAATVNGEPILCGTVIEPHRQYLMSARQKMQHSSKDSARKDCSDTPKDFEELRASLVQRELPMIVQRIIIRQYLTSHLAPNGRARIIARIDELFEEEIKRLEQEMNVANQEDLEAELQKIGGSLQRIKENIALQKFVEVGALSGVSRIVPVSDVEIQAYYENRGHEFEQPEMLDVQLIGFRYVRLSGTRYSNGRGRAKARALINELETFLNEGESFEDAIKRFSESTGFFSRTWNEAQFANFPDSELRSALRLNPLNQWSRILEPELVVQGQSETAESSKTESKSSEASPAFGNSDLSAGIFAISNNAEITVNSFQGIVNPAAKSNETTKSSSQSLSTVDVEKAAHYAPENSDGENSYFLVRVTARREACTAPLETVRDVIRDALALNRKKALLKNLIGWLNSKAVIQSSYEIQGIVEERIDDEVAARELNLLQSPDEDSIGSMNPWQFERAIEVLDFAIRQDPSNERYFRDRGFFKLALGQAEQAIADYDEAVRLDPTSAKACFERARALLTSPKNTDRGLIDLDEAIRMDPNLASAYFYRGSARFLTGNQSDGLADLNRAVQLEPNAIHYVYRGTAHIYLQETEQALSDFDEAIRLDDKCVDAYLGRRRVWILKSDVSKELKDLDRALELDPLHVEAHRLRGIRLLQLNQIDRALADLSLAVQLNEIEDADALTWRSIAWARKGDMEKAVTDLKDAKRLNPHHKIILFNHSTFYIAASESEKVTLKSGHFIYQDSPSTMCAVIGGTVIFTRPTYDQPVAGADDAIRQ